MKKAVFAIVAILAIAVGMQAQDTLSADTLKSSYLCPQWPDFSKDSIIIGILYSSAEDEKVTGKLIESGDDTITVYGLAVSAETWNMSIGQSAIWEDGHIVGYQPDSSTYYARLNTMCDTSAYEEAYELWGLYKRVPATPNDSLQRVSPLLPINIKLDTPTYILTFNTYKDGSYTEHTPPLPVYELFFHTPQQISGSFYMAVTNRIHAMGSACGKSFYTWPIFSRVVTPSNPAIWEEKAFYVSYLPTPRWVFGQQGLLTFNFPILTPPDSGYVWDTTVVAGDTVFSSGDTIVILGGDTIVANGDTTVIANGDTIFVAGGSAIVCDTSIVLDTVIVRDTAVVGGDTIVYFDTIIRNDTIISYDILLSIGEVSLLQRLTGVMPNPAAETAKVVSSFGVKRVEAYNMAGEKVHDQWVPDGSLSATLDIRRWPTGAYILRIHTPRGVTAKKLTVRR